MNVIDDAALLRLAEAEIIEETKRAKIRHATAGPSGWQPIPKPNKSFLVNTLLQTLSSNRILAKKQTHPEKTDRKLLQKDKKSNFTYQKPKKPYKKEDKKSIKAKLKIQMKSNKCKSKKRSKIKGYSTVEGEQIKR